MKGMILTLLTCITVTIHVYAQEWNLGVPYVIWVADEDGKVFRNKPVSAIVQYNNADHNILYRESHTGMTNSLGNMSFLIGNGTPLEGELTLDDFKEVVFLGYEITTDDEGSPVIISGEREVGAVPRANAAACANTSMTSLNALGLGGINWGGFGLGIGTLLCPPQGYSYRFPLVEEINGRGIEQSFVQTSVTDLVRLRQAPEASPSGPEINYLNIGAGLGKPMYCGPDPLYISAMHSIRMPSIGNLLYGAEVVLQNYDADHHTYAILAQNLNSTGGGILASSPSRGIVSVGQSSGEFQSIGSGNGFGTYSLVLVPPLAGGYKYGASANSMDHPDSYSFVGFGMAGGTHPWVVFSDARLKKNVRTDQNVLNLIGQLRPASYEYINDSPYPLAKGLQHGFIAQEIESVFPELVNDFVVPITLDPERMTSCETVRYKSVNYDGLVSILTAGIQDLDEIVKSQQAEIHALTTTINELTTRIEALEK